MGNVYSNLIKSIKKDSVIVIDNKQYNVKTKTHYANIKNTELKYTKFVLSDENILVINADRKSIFLGKIVNDFYKGEKFPKQFTYQGKKFKKFEEDYQVVTKIEFGEPCECEGECLWVDYACENDDEICIDMAYVYRDKKRADILAKWIDIGDIKLLNK